jgi:hypothetical protein
MPLFVCKQGDWYGIVEAYDSDAARIKTQRYFKVIGSPRRSLKRIEVSHKPIESLKESIEGVIQATEVRSEEEYIEIIKRRTKLPDGRRKLK